MAFSSSLLCIFKHILVQALADALSKLDVEKLAATVVGAEQQSELALELDLSNQLGTRLFVLYLFG